MALVGSYLWICIAGVVFALLVNRWNAQKLSRPAKLGRNSSLWKAWRKGNYSVTFPRALSAEECLKIRTLLQGSGEAALVGGTMGGLLRENVRVAEMLTVEPSNEQFRWLFERLWHLAEAANEHWKLKPLWEIEPLNLVSYPAAQLHSDVNGHYDWHTDLMPESQREGRLLSLSIQLSNSSDYLGGQLLVGTETASRGLGDAVVFPSYMAHSVYPVVKGERLALVAWIRGRLNNSLAVDAMAAHVQAIQDTGSWKALQTIQPRKAQPAAANPAAPLGLRRIYGSHLLHTGRPAEAAEVLRRVALEDPHSPGALNNLAVAEYRQGRTPAAIDALLYAARLRPNDGEVHANLGRFFYLEGRLPLGTYHLSKAVMVWHHSAILLAIFILACYCFFCGIFWCCCLRLLGWPHQVSNTAVELTAEEKKLLESAQLGAVG